MISSASTVDDLLKQGIAAARAGRKDEARQKLMRVVELDEENEQAWLWLSGVVESNDDRRVCLENVLTINPANAAAHKGLRLLDGQKLPQRRERCPHCQAEISATANTCRACGQPVLVACPQCRNYVEIVTRKCPTCGWLLGDYHDRAIYFLDLAEAYLEHDNYQSAIWATDRLTADQSTVPNGAARLRLAKLYLRLDKTSHALEIYRQAIEQDPQNVAAYLKLGELYRQQDNRVELQALYHDAHRRLPAETAITLAWARVLLEERGSTDQAIELLQSAIEIDPANAEAHALLGRVYLRADQPSIALTNYRRVAELAPPDSPLAVEAQRELRLLKHVEPEGWGEFLRHMLGFMLCPILAALAAASLSPLKINVVSWLALLTALVASWLWVSSADMPHNPVTVKTFGAARARRLQMPAWNVTGKILWVVSFVILVVRG
jgi:tetratricopeptide (TPR) repeat protein